MTPVDMANLKALRVAQQRGKELQAKNEVLEHLVKTLTMERDRAREQAEQAEERVTNRDRVIAVLQGEKYFINEELQHLREHNEALEKHLDALVAMQIQSDLPKDAETALVDYPKTELDAKIIARQYDPDRLKNAIATFTGSMKWYRKYWYILFRFLLEYKVLVPGCTKANFARWVEATFPDAGKSLAKAMKPFRSYYKKQSVGLDQWLENPGVCKDYKTLIHNIIRRFTDGKGQVRTEFRAIAFSGVQEFSLRRVKRCQLP